MIGVKSIKEKIIGASSGIGGALSLLGGYQVCHNACLALVGFLTFLGFAVAGMPLFFLTKVAIPFWVAAFLLLVLAMFLKYKGMHISGKASLLNSGLIIAGTPFQQVQQYNYIFWIIGGVLVLFSVGWYFYDKIEKNKK